MEDYMFEMELIKKYFPISYGLYLLECNLCLETEKYAKKVFPRPTMDSIKYVKEDFVNKILERWTKSNIYYNNDEIKELLKIKFQEEYGSLIVNRAKMYIENEEFCYAVDTANHILENINELYSYSDKYLKLKKGK